MNVSYLILVCAIIAILVLSLVFYYIVCKRMNELENICAEYARRVEESAYSKKEVEELEKIIQNLKLENVERESIEPDDAELPIHIITSDQFYFDRAHSNYYGPCYEKYTLHYNVMTNEIKFIAKNGDIVLVENVKELIGDGLMFFGLHSKDSNRVYVRNHNFLSDFEIIKEME